MANEQTLWTAIVSLVEADTGTGGLVELTARTNPLVEWSDIGLNTRPITAGILLDITPRPPTAVPLTIRGRFSALVDASDAGIESDLLDRLEAVLTNPAFTSLGLDVAVYVRRRRDNSPLERGARRKDMDLDFEYDR